MLLDKMPEIQLTLLVGKYAQSYYLEDARSKEPDEFGHGL